MARRSRSLGGFALLVLATACSRPERRAQETVSTLPSAAPPPPASSAAPPPPPPDAALAEPPVFPTPKTPPGADPEKVAFASAICAAAHLPRPTFLTRGDKIRVGCRSHPPFVRPEQQPDGKLPLHSEDPLTFCGIERIHHGSFTRSGAKQAVIAFDPCKEDDATWDMGNPGSAVLVEEIGGRWKPVGYQGGVNAGECKKSQSKGGRDVLLCQSGFGSLSTGFVTYFFLLDFGRKEAVGTIARLFDDAFDCRMIETVFQYQLPAGLTSVRVANVVLADVNGDGTQDLVVDVDRAHLPASPALDAKVRAACKANPDTNGKSLFPPPKRTRLELVSDADVFAPTPASQKELDAWEAQATDLAKSASAATPKNLEKTAD